MRLIVKTQSGGTHIIEADSGDSVESLREKVHRATGVLPILQRLVVTASRDGRVELQDGRTLGESHLEMESELFLAARQPPIVVELSLSGTRYAVELSALLAKPDSRLFAMFEGLE